MVVATVGASFVLATVSTYESEAVVPASSVQVTVIVCVPTSALTGVPEIVVPEIVMVLGAPAMVYARLSPASTSAHIPDTLRLYAASSFVLASAIADATVGASLTLVTVSTYESEAVAPASSVQVTVIVCVPTSALTGVPEIVVPEIVMVLGAPAMVYARLSPASTSVHSPDTLRL